MPADPFNPFTPGGKARRIIRDLVAHAYRPFEDDSELTALGIDSLDIAHIALNLEGALGIEIDVDEFPRGCTVGHVVALAEAKILAKSQPVPERAA